MSFEQDKEPTQEQIKKFWEWCGFRWWDTAEAWCFGKDEVSRELPNIDLNNLFKYAPVRMTAILWRKIIREWASTLTGNYEKDTLALFWALYSIIDKTP